MQGSGDIEDLNLTSNVFKEFLHPSMSYWNLFHCTFVETFGIIPNSTRRVTVLTLDFWYPTIYGPPNHSGGIQVNKIFSTNYVGT